MRIAWASKGPPAALAVGGDEAFQRNEVVRKLIRQAHRNDYEVIHAQTDGEVIDGLTMAGTFRQPTFIVVPVDVVSPSTVKDAVEEALPKCGMLLVAERTFNEKKMPALAEVHPTYQFGFDVPGRKGDRTKKAVRFVRGAAKSQLGAGALDEKLAKALVSLIGDDLGTLFFEVSKCSAWVRSQGGTTIAAADLRATVAALSGADMQPLRDALGAANTQGVAKALRKIKARSAFDPTMLLLRSRGGPADLAVQWLRAARLLEKGADAQKISRLLGTPAWAVERSVIPAAKKWGAQNLTRLVRDLASVDRGVLNGIPAPWVACEAALLRGCGSVAG